jgi:hypothetical protein
LLAVVVVKDKMQEMVVRVVEVVAVLEVLAQAHLM